MDFFSEFIYNSFALFYISFERTILGTSLDTGGMLIAVKSGAVAFFLYKTLAFGFIYMVYK